MGQLGRFGLGYEIASRQKLHPAHIAQAAERILGKDKVPGSNPGVGSRTK